MEFILDSKLVLVLVLSIISFLALLLNVYCHVDRIRGSKASIVAFAPDVTMIAFIILAIKTGVWLPLAIDTLMKRFAYGILRELIVGKELSEKYVEKAVGILRSNGVNVDDGGEAIITIESGELTEVMAIDHDGTPRVVRCKGEDNEIPKEGDVLQTGRRGESPRGKDKQT